MRDLTINIASKTLIVNKIVYLKLESVMRTYLADIIPKIQRFSRKLDDLTKLTNQHWILLGDITDTKRVFMFRTNNELLIFENGVRIDKGSWEYLGNQSLLLETSSGGFLLKHGFFDENVMALKIDSTYNYVFFVNETKYESELNNINDVLNFLKNKYLENQQEGRNLNNYFTTIPLYRESEPAIDWDIVKGKHFLIQIIFENGISHNIYQGFKTKKYFYTHSVQGIIYCENKEDCIKQLYNHIMQWV